MVCMNQRKINPQRIEVQQRAMERQPAVAGLFYPRSKAEIKAMLDHFFNYVNLDKEFAKYKNELKQKFSNSKRGKINGIIVPHAGWIYSGLTAAYAYDLLKEYKFKKFILIGPNHTAYLNNAAIDENNFWQTPLGRIKVLNYEKNHENKSSDVHKLFDDKLFILSSIPHEQEHDLEVQAPFLQYLFNGSIEILPIIIGDLDLKQLEKASDRLLNLYDDDTLFIISTDLSHYQQQQQANRLDKNTIEVINSLSFDRFEEIDACGKNPLLIAMFLCKKLKTRPLMLKYTTSGDITKDYSKGVVGYVSMVF
ncbi:AmmeMemoRadiSam system protein B [Candidatus Woesearchaeota archaeon]|nr:AmmeMemoRadiSam system protein B [Candidatus Woesearchaeota archaeon]